MAILFVTSLALANKGKAIDIYAGAVLPDGQQLKVGMYKVIVDEAADDIQFFQNSDVIAKHRCKSVAQEEKNRYNQARYAEGPEKKQCLTRSAWRGERRPSF